MGRTGNHLQEHQQRFFGEMVEIETSTSGGRAENHLGPIISNNTKQRLRQGSVTTMGGQRKLHPRDPDTEPAQDCSWNKTTESPSRLPPGAKHQVTGSSNKLLRERYGHGEMSLWDAGMQTRLKGKWEQNQWTKASHSPAPTLSTR